MMITLDVLKKVILAIKFDSLSFTGKGVFFITVNETNIFLYSFGEDGSTNMIYVSENDLIKDAPYSNRLDVQFEFNHSYSFDFQVGIIRNTENSEVNREIDDCLLVSIRELILQNIQFYFERLNVEKLLKSTNNLYSSIEVEQVVQVVLVSIRELFSDYDSYVWLSHDYEHQLPVKVLSFQGAEMNDNTKAFIMGEALHYELDGKKAFSAPMRGKQGVYGVLQFIQNNPYQDIQKDVRNIILLADTAGTALENANLYHQSQRLISQLQIINEASEQLSKTLNLESNIDFLLSKVHSTFKPEGVYFLAFIKNKNVYKLVESTEHAIHNEEFSILPGTILHDVHQSREPILTTSYKEDTNGLLTIGKNDIPYHSLMIVPMLHHQQVEGMVVLTHSNLHHFSYDDFRLLKTLVRHASFAYVNSSLHEQLNRMVITDHLTRLFTRNYLNQIILLSQSKDFAGSLLLIDIDNFKKINDTYGHQVGDDILIQVANVIKTSVRETDTAARWGGEELAIYLPNISLDQAIQIAERIRERVGRETSPRVTISCGVSYWRQQDNDNSLELLFNQSDKALYSAKDSGKNRVMVSKE